MKGASVDLHSYLKRLFAYDDWANREVLGSLQALPYAPHKAARLAAHIVAVEFVWLARLKGEPDPAVWPEWNLEHTANQQREIAPRLQDYLRSISANDLAHEMEYSNTKGERWKNSIADILMHTVMHSAYHRGQIAMVLRDTGVTPPYTDYIQAVRTHCLEE